MSANERDWTPPTPEDLVPLIHEEMMVIPNVDPDMIHCAFINAVGVEVNQWDHPQFGPVVSFRLYYAPPESCSAVWGVLEDGVETLSTEFVVRVAGARVLANALLGVMGS